MTMVLTKPEEQRVATVIMMEMESSSTIGSSNKYLTGQPIRTMVLLQGTFRIAIGVVRIFNSDNVDVYNNTTYNNGLNAFCDTSQGGCPSPSHDEILFSGQNNNIVNNILYASNPGTTDNNGQHLSSVTLNWTSAYGKPDTGNNLTNNIMFVANSPGNNGIVVSGTTNDSGYLASIT